MQTIPFPTIIKMVNMTIITISMADIITKEIQWTVWGEYSIVNCCTIKRLIFFLQSNRPSHCFNDEHVTCILSCIICYVHLTFVFWSGYCIIYCRQISWKADAGQSRVYLGMSWIHNHHCIRVTLNMQHRVVCSFCLII